jgi:hypothetical protein
MCFVPARALAALVTRVPRDGVARRPRVRRRGEVRPTLRAGAPSVPDSTDAGTPQEIMSPQRTFTRWTSSEAIQRRLELRHPPAQAEGIAVSARHVQRFVCGRARVSERGVGSAAPFERRIRRDHYAAVALGASGPVACLARVRAELARTRRHLRQTRGWRRTELLGEP